MEEVHISGMFMKIIFIFLVSSLGYSLEKTETTMELSEYVTIVMTVPETHADVVRDAMGKAGAGKVGNYSYCSFSVKGTGRFRPDEGANPFIGQAGVLETVAEERIETVCQRERLKVVLEAIKKAHPYEETVIDIYPVYQIGMKKAKS